MKQIGNLLAGPLNLPDNVVVSAPASRLVGVDLIPRSSHTRLENGIRVASAWCLDKAGFH